MMTTTNARCAMISMRIQSEIHALEMLLSGDFHTPEERLAMEAERDALEMRQRALMSGEHVAALAMEM